MPARTRHCGFEVTAKAQHHAALPFGHDIEAARKPHREYETCEQTGSAEAPRTSSLGCGSTTIAASSTEKTFQLTIEIAPELFQVGWALIASAGLAAPLRIVERHQHAPHFQRALPDIVAKGP